MSYPGPYPEFILAACTVIVIGSFGMLWCKWVSSVSAPKFKIVMNVGWSAKLLNKNEE